MAHAGFHCPFCKGLLVPPGGTDEGLTAADLHYERLYCPSCEMLVHAIEETGGTVGADALTPDDTPPNPGRNRASGSNAGGSQRGDDSDEGATQWLTDPKEIERNTWSDKD